MTIMVFGATGRVGRAVVRKAIAAGHDVSIFVRAPGALTGIDANVFSGDVCDSNAVEAALSRGFDAVVVCIGQAGLKPSTVITKGFKTIVDAMTSLQQKRFIGVSGTAEMPRKTWTGRLYTALLRRTPVGNAVRDHDGGLSVLLGSDLEWTLAGCNYLADGPERGRYQTSLTFPGGFKVIHPADVADFLLKEVTAPRFVHEVVGLWY